MEIDDSAIRSVLSQHLTDAVIRIGIIALLVGMCVRIFAPFADLALWAVILAIALYPVQQPLAKRLGGRQGRAALLLVVAALLLIGIPTVMLGRSFATRVHKAYTAYESNAVTIKQPDPAVADWPVIGKSIYSTWNAAANNLPAYLEENKQQIENLLKIVLSAAARTAKSVLLFLISLILAGVVMAYGELGNHAMQRIFNRLAGPVRGPQLQRLSTATIRSVATGVIGVAFIQALLLGIGFIVADIPAAGVLALVALLLGIVQLPTALVSLPAIGYLWWSGDTSTVSNILFTIYFLAAGLSDNVLKPLLLGRGVDAPMPVILFGALGGVISGGINGMFVGAVVLAVGYQLFMDWVNTVEDVPATKPEQTGTTDSD